MPIAAFAFLSFLSLYHSHQFKEMFSGYDSPLRNRHEGVLHWLQQIQMKMIVSIDRMKSLSISKHGCRRSVWILIDVFGFADLAGDGLS
jgi:hypothetical protein